MKTKKRNSNRQWYGACLSTIIFAVILFLPLLGNSFTKLKKHSSPLAADTLTRISSTRHPATIRSATKIKKTRIARHSRKNRRSAKPDFLKDPASPSVDKLFTLLGTAIQMQDLHFKLNAKLPALANWKEEIDSILQPYLSGMEEYDNILIVGYTDNTGSKKTNLQLSAQRASTIAACLVKLGIPENRIQIAALGEAYPITTNTTLQGRNANRRVEINFLKS